MFTKQKETQHTLITIKLSQDTKTGVLKYDYEIPDKFVDRFYIVEGLAVMLNALIEGSHKERISIPKQLEKFKYKIPKEK